MEGLSQSSSVKIGLMEISKLDIFMLVMGSTFESWFTCQVFFLKMTNQRHILAKFG
jgi:hypothetical protein